MAESAIKMETVVASCSSAQRPPMVKGDPVIGSLRPLLKDPHVFLKQAYKDYGSAFRFQAVTRNFVVLAGVEANRFVSAEGKDLFSVDGFWGETGRYMSCPHMLSMVDGEIHQYQRKIMAPALLQQRFKNNIDAMAGNIIELIERRAKTGKLDFGSFARQMLSNQLSSTLHGYKAPHWKVETMISTFNTITKVFGLRSLPHMALYSPAQKYREYITFRELKKTIDKARNRSEAEKKAYPYYLDLIMPALAEKPEWFSEGDLMGHTMLPFVGALDTIAATQGFMMYRLLKNPNLYQRIQREVDEVFSQGVPDFATLKSMEDLNGLFRETMRVQPTAFGIVRSAKDNFLFNDYQVNKGEDVLIFTTADHFNPQYFSDPQSFDIERYREPRNEHRQPAFAPFGKGPHNCIGASLSELLMPLHMGLMLYLLDIKPACDLDKVKETYGPAPVLSKNFKIQVRQRRVM